MSWKNLFPKENKYFETENGILYCCNCLEMLSKFSNKCIDLIIIDPPYLTTKESWDKKEVVNEILVGELYRVAKDNCSLYVWCGIGEKSQSLIRWFPLFNKLWHFKDLITWKKQRGIGMRKGWLYTREEIMWFVRDNKKYIWREEYQYSNEKRSLQNLGANGKPRKSPYKRFTNVWTDIEMKGNFGTHKEFKNIKHFTPKPLKAIERIIKVHTFENNLVLDPFLGSGTTAIACEKLNRRWIGIEINPEYCEVAKKRILEVTKQKQKITLR